MGVAAGHASIGAVEIRFSQPVVAASLGPAALAWEAATWLGSIREPEARLPKERRGVHG
jgi:hypothetical protein